VSAVVGVRFGGSYRAAFDHYDRNRVGRVDAEGLIALLADAAIGTRLCRLGWAVAVLAETDRDGDGSLGWEEFATAFGYDPASDGEAAAVRREGVGR
jgi:Ca2+-binding EF-hand superfamily protein